MEKIGRRIWTYMPANPGKAVMANVDEVGASPGVEVKDFPELVERVATVGYLNSRFNLFFRGQGRDHRIQKRGGTAGVSSIYPSLYRNKGRSLPKAERHERLEKLRWYTDALTRSYPGPSPRDRSRLERFAEASWALLQHYQVCPTPLIDVTQSLRVASSFATMDRTDGLAYLYVFGMPNVNGSISFSADEAIVLVRLQSVCPPAAKRAHFQEGYLVGQFPWVRRKYAHLNLARRMLAKFALRANTFWNDDFPPIAKRALMPDKDRLLDYFDDLEDGRI
jgi:hypothetical protein